MANNLAQNHLSKIASKGRFGDTELVHVNQQEKDLLKSLGGSGTINPETGLNEYWVFQAATLGLGLWEASKAGKTQSQAAASQSAAAQEGLKALNLAEGQLGQATEAKKELALLSHKKKVSDLSFTTETSVSDLNKEMDKALKKSNLVTSGSVNERESDISRRISKSFTSGTEGLMGQLGETMATIEGDFESEKTRLKMERTRLTREKELADKSADSYYLGKGIV